MHSLRFPNSGIRAKPAGATPEASPAGTTAYNMSLARRAGCRTPARDCHPRPSLPPAGAATSVAGVATPWQGDYRWARETTACAGVATAAMAQRV
ncbi:hypothetical protein BHE74_00042752 [Ensete ventricosum]|nr:hypothetical protein BHE74_00042752 [Ensete ventricosum]